jgi:hypothetical protein
MPRTDGGGTDGWDPGGGDADVDDDGDGIGVGVEQFCPCGCVMQFGGVLGAGVGALLDAMHPVCAGLVRPIPWLVSHS